MPTSFNCHIHIQESLHTGQFVMRFGPFSMGDLQELLDWIASDEGRDKIMDSTARLVRWGGEQKGEIL